MISTKKLPRYKNKSIIYVPISYFVMLQTIFNRDNVEYTRLSRSEMNDVDCENWMRRFQNISSSPKIRIKSMCAIETNLDSNDIFHICELYDTDKETQDFVNNQHCLIINKDFIPWTNNE